MRSTLPPRACSGRLAVRLSLLAVALAVFPAASAAKPKVGSGKGGVELKRLGKFDSVTHVENAPGFKKLLFVVEQPGKIQVLHRDKKLKRPFLNIEGLVECCGEEGLLSVAFPRDYKLSRRFYVYYTAAGGDVIRVDEFRRSAPTSADPSSRRTVIELSHPDSSGHNGGQLQFGPDGYLYVGTGDGGGGGDYAQNPNSPLGKILRIDPLPGNAGAHGIPPDNPFAGPAPGLDEVYALGLRNPWRFSFDRNSGRIAIADVGEKAWEEVNYETRSVARGANFGWNAFEGTHRFDMGMPVPAEHELPIHEYPNDGSNCAVTGGYVVRDRKLKSLYGRYLYSDHCSADLRSLVPRLDGARRDRALGQSVSGGVTSFGEGVRGRIYVASGGGVWTLKRK